MAKKNNVKAEEANNNAETPSVDNTQVEESDIDKFFDASDNPNPETKNVKGEDITKIAEDESIVIWRINRPVSDLAHQSIRNKLNIEEKGTGKKIMLVPFSVDAAIKK